MPDRIILKFKTRASISGLYGIPTFSTDQLA